MGYLANFQKLYMIWTILMQNLNKLPDYRALLCLEQAVEGLEAVDGEGGECAHSWWLVSPVIYRYDQAKLDLRVAAVFLHHVEVSAPDVGETQCNLKHVFREWFRHFYVLSLNWMKPTPFDPIGYAVSQKNYPFSQKFIFGHSRNLSSEVFGKNLVFCL